MKATSCIATELATIPLTDRLHKMQSSSSVPVLILMLCCMASAHNAMYNRAIHHLETSQDCGFPPNTSQSCKDALNAFANNLDNAAALPSIMEKLCDPNCVKSMNVALECIFGPSNIGEFLCVTYKNKYCYVIVVDFKNSCGP